MMEKRQVRINPHSPSGAMLHGEETRHSPGGLRVIFLKYADKCSMGGISFIARAENQLVRVIWVCLLIITCGLMTCHLYLLAVTYFDYKTQTEIQLSFSHLQFPAVTICNVNPLRKSQINLASLDLTEFIYRVDPTVFLHHLETEAEEDIGLLKMSGKGSKQSGKTRPGKNTTTHNQNPPSRTLNRPKIKGKLFKDLRGRVQSSPLETAKEEYINEKYRHSWEAKSEASTLWLLEQTFQQIFLNHSRSTRSKMGHQISDMLLQCSFAGRQCEDSNFTLVLNARRGNCFTLQHPEFITRTSGPTDGLQLKLFLETDEYMPVVSSSKGIQVAIHDQKTVPFPEQEGLAVGAGTETFIGLRKVQVSRLNKPYGLCKPVESFENTYGFKYTRVACQKVCHTRRIQRECGCYDNQQQEIYSFLNSSRNMKPCSNPKEIMCALEISLLHQNSSNSECDCYQPCSETSFETTVSSRPWPGSAFASLLSEAACEGESAVCDNLPLKQASDLREEFINLNIYYEDLNYEDVTERADYEFDQFLSDVGGTIGLWIGLSALTTFEIFHLLFDIFCYVFCKKCH